MATVTTYVREVYRVSENIYIPTMYDTLGRLYQLELGNDIPLGTVLTGVPRYSHPVTMNVLIPDDPKIIMADGRWFFVQPPPDI